MQELFPGLYVDVVWRSRQGTFTGLPKGNLDRSGLPSRRRGQRSYENALTRLVRQR
jgi:hypothetical protein